MKQIIRVFYLTLFITAIIPLGGQENTENETQKETPAPAKSEEKTETPETVPETVEVKTPLAAKKSAKTEDKKEKKIDGPILKYPGLADEFKLSYSEHDPLEHTMINFMYGLISGGLIGFAGGLSFYTSDTDLTNVYIAAIATGGVGGVAGIVISMIENANETPFSIGKPLFNYSWYGVFAGALTGSLAGLIPYAMTNNTNDLVNFIGYGTFAGLATGMVLYFIIPPSKQKNIIFDSNPLATRVGYKFLF